LRKRLITFEHSQPETFLNTCTRSIKHLANKAVHASRDMVADNFDLSVRWRYVVSFKLRPLQRHGPSTHSIGHLSSGVHQDAVESNRDISVAELSSCAWFMNAHCIRLKHRFCVSVRAFKIASCDDRSSCSHSRYTAASPDALMASIWPQIVDSVIYLMGCLPTFRTNLLPSCVRLPYCFFVPEDGGNTLLANISKVVPGYTVSQHRTVTLT
jgi:hypothetical protein